jgi:YD repeat-containing protein
VLAIKIEPVGQVINAWISLRNRDGLVPGSEVDIWNLNPNTGEFKITGTGRVRDDGEWVETVRGRVTWASLVFIAPVAPRALASVDMNGHNRAPTLLADGNVSQAIALPGVISLGQDRSQTLIYNSALADPRPIVATDTTIFARTGVPVTIEALLEVGGVTVAGPALVDTNDPAPLPEDVDATIRHALQFDAGALETGIHPYRFTATANYGCSTVSTAIDGEIIVDNESDSPFGAGWTLDGLERLHFEEDGDILLTEGDGSAKAFDSRPAGKFFPPIGIPARDPGAGTLDDFNGDGHLDMAVPAMDTGELVVLLGDGTGEFPVDRRFFAGGPRSKNGPPDVHSVASGDFNNDGIRDLVVNNQLGDSRGDYVRIYLGRGDGTFQLVQPLIKVGRPQGVGVADFDGDGNDDFVVATAAGLLSTQHRTYVYFGDGTGTFPRIQPFNRVEEPTNVAIADFDNNGAPDFAVASGKGRIYMMLNDGAGNFVKGEIDVEPILWVIGRYPLAAADFNGDGIQDLAATVNDGVHFAIYFGDGFGGISSQLLVQTGIGEVNSVTATDYDEDGDMDVVASGRFTGAIVLFEADGAGNVVVDETVPLPAAPLHSVRAGDFNHDDAPDIQTGDRQNIYVLIADRSGNNRFRSPGADFSTLAKNDDGTYVRRMTDGTVIEYSEDGLMTARVDANGNRTEYSYNADGLLTGISDPADPNRSTVFDYQGGVCPESRIWPGARPSSRSARTAR